MRMTVLEMAPLYMCTHTYYIEVGRSDRTLHEILIHLRTVNLSFILKQAKLQVQRNYPCITGV